MPRVAGVALEPRKTPVQARSAASVEAMLEAAVQVLLNEGKERLTTRKVADRAGVSVGTLYQYFPNKSALLQAVLRDHLDGVARTIERVCGERKGETLDAMATSLVEEFMRAKMLHVARSRALYSVSDDVRGAEIARQNAARNIASVAGMLESAEERLKEDARVVAAIVLATMAGVSRRILESQPRDGELEAMQRGLATMVRAYLAACVVG